MRRVFHQEILPLDGAIARHETKHGKNTNHRAKSQARRCIDPLVCTAECA